MALWRLARQELIRSHREAPGALRTHRGPQNRAPRSAQAHPAAHQDHTGPTRRVRPALPAQPPSQASQHTLPVMLGRCTRGFGPGWAFRNPKVKRIGRVRRLAALVGKWSSPRTGAACQRRKAPRATNTDRLQRLAMSALPLLDNVAYIYFCFALEEALNPKP